MKKKTFFSTALAFIVLTGSQALACYWDGHPGGYYADTYTDGRYQDFWDDTAQLRQDLAAKQGEYKAVMAKPDPDPDRVAGLGREIAALDIQLRTRSQAYNLSAASAKYNYAARDWYGYGCW